jgi:hypothetical protein
LLAGALALSAAELTGWFTCSNCKAGNASSKVTNRECAETCIKGGADAMFVTENGHKLFKVADKKLALSNIKTKVKVSGNVQGDALTVTKVEKAD